MNADQEGIKLEGTHLWKTEGRYGLTEVLLALPRLVPSGSMLYIEGTSIADDINELLSTHAVASTVKVCPGTVYPKPAVYHIPATPEILKELAALADRHNEQEVCDHLHVYLKGKMLLSGYDFMDQPLELSETISEENVAEFCRATGCRYIRCTAEGG